MMQYFTADDGAKIAYRDTGAGQPLLCLAGLTRNAKDFNYLAPHLPDVRMICMDYRGRGASDWTGADTYTIEREATDVVQLLAHLGLNRVPILGTSRGGLVGMGLAATLPDMVSGICFNDIGPVIETRGLETIRNYIGRNPGWRSMDAALEAMSTGVAGFANVPRVRWLQEIETHFKSDGNSFSITYDPALATAFLEAFVDPLPDAWPLFEALADKPVALIRGANSELLSQDTADEMARRHPGMGFANVPDRGHVPFLDEPEALSVIRAFLSEVA